MRENLTANKTYSIVANANIDAPGASGDSAMLEIGASITPTNYKAFNAILIYSYLPE